jgi:hypothetical protein
MGARLTVLVPARHAATLADEITAEPPPAPRD